MHEEWEKSVARRIRPAEKPAAANRQPIPRCGKCSKPVLTPEQIQTLRARTSVEDMMFLTWCTCDYRSEVAAQRRERESVYIVGNREVGFVKVGYSQTEGAKIRIAEIAAYLPFELKVFAIMHGPMRLERAIHRYLMEARSRGEWFYLTPAVDEVIAAAKSGRLEALAAAWISKAKPMDRLDLAELLHPPVSPLARMKKRG